MSDPEEQASVPDAGSGPPPDIAFRATVRCGRLRFEEDPLTAVRFPGSGPRASLSCCERTNLPGEVVAGEEYRDASVTYRLATRLTGRPEDYRDAEKDTNTRTSGRDEGRADPRTGRPGQGSRGLEHGQPGQGSRGHAYGQPGQGSHGRPSGRP